MKEKIKFYKNLKIRSSKLKKKDHVQYAWRNTCLEINAFF